MSQQIFGLKRLSDLPELKERAQDVLEGLEKGEIELRKLITSRI